MAHARRAHTFLHAAGVLECSARGHNVFRELQAKGAASQDCLSHTTPMPNQRTRSRWRGTRRRVWLTSLACWSRPPRTSSKPGVLCDRLQARWEILSRPPSLLSCCRFSLCAHETLPDLTCRPRLVRDTVNALLLFRSAQQKCERAGVVPAASSAARPPLFLLRGSQQDWYWPARPTSLLERSAEG